MNTDLDAQFALRTLPHFSCAEWRAQRARVRWEREYLRMRCDLLLAELAA